MGILFVLTTLFSGILGFGKEPTKKIHWYLAEVPAVHIAEGSRKHQGFIDQILYKKLIPSLPNYNHETEYVPIARREGLFNTDTASCAPGLFKSPLREGSLIFSEPYLATLVPGIFSLKNESDHLKKFLNKNGKLDLNSVMKTEKFIVGVVSGRSYGTSIDQVIQDQGTAKNIYTISSKGGIESLAKMMTRKRIHLVLGNPYESSFAVAPGTEKKDEFIFWPVSQSTEYQLVYVGCTKSKKGQKIIGDINKVVRAPEFKAAALGYFQEWLEPTEFAAAKNAQIKAFSGKE